MLLNIYPTIKKDKKIWVARKKYNFNGVDFTKIFYCKTKDDAIKKIK